MELKVFPPFQVANIAFATGRLAIGGDLADEGDVALAQQHEIVDRGITHVLDVREEWDDTGLWDGVDGVTYHRDGIDDAGQQVPPEWFDGAVAWCVDAMHADPATRVLTHCHMGVNRGPSTGYAVLLALGWDPVDALATIRAARPIAGIAYAEDALDWHLLRTGATPSEGETARARVAEWRAENPMDVAHTIRQIRAEETGT